MRDSFSPRSGSSVFPVRRTSNSGASAPWDRASFPPSSPRFSRSRACFSFFGDCFGAAFAPRANRFPRTCRFCFSRRSFSSPFFLNLSDSCPPPSRSSSSDGSPRATDAWAKPSLPAAFALVFVGRLAAGDGRVGEALLLALILTALAGLLFIGWLEMPVPLLGDSLTDFFSGGEGA